MINLKSKYGKIYRIKMDQSIECGGVTASDKLWLYQIPCRYGHVFVAGKARLGAHCDRRGVIVRLLAIPGVRADQRGDREVNVSFDPAIFPQVAELLQARKRPVFSEETLAARREVLARINSAKRPKDVTDAAPAPP